MSGYMCNDDVIMMSNNSSIQKLTTIQDNALKISKQI